MWGFGKLHGCQILLIEKAEEKCFKKSIIALHYFKLTLFDPCPSANLEKTGFLLTKITYFDKIYIMRRVEKIILKQHISVTLLTTK